MIDIFAVVTKQNGAYRLSVFCDETVPPFGPTLPNPPDFQVTTTYRLTVHIIFFGCMLLDQGGSKAYSNGNVPKSQRDPN